MNPRRILVVDDEKNQRDILQMILSGERDEAGEPLYDVTIASSGQEALKRFKHERFDLVLTDLKMPGMDGIQLLNDLSQIESATPVILMTANRSIDSVKDTLRGGAFDYLEKPLDRKKLLSVMQDAVSRMRAVDEEIIGVSDTMERVKKMIVKVAGSNSTVLIRGESGTGKERIARAIHKASPRVAERFQAVNCAAINENLLESELFGHEKGAFTGAVAEKKGLFEIADKGTLLLDEIGDLNVGMQAKLLRALQEKEIQRVGGTRPIKIDVRVLAATNRELEAMVKDNRFREDLYYRLNAYRSLCRLCASAGKILMCSSTTFSASIQLPLPDTSKFRARLAKCFWITRGREMWGSSNLRSNARCYLPKVTRSRLRICRSGPADEPGSGCRRLQAAA